MKVCEISLSSVQRALHVAIEQSADAGLIDSCEVKVWKDALKATRQGAVLSMSNTAYYDESGTLNHRH